MADCSKLLQRIDTFIKRQNISGIPEAGKLKDKEIAELIYDPAYVVNTTEKVNSLKKFISDIKKSKIVGKDDIVDYLEKKVDFSTMAVSKRNFEISTQKSEFVKNMSITEYNTFSFMYSKLKWSNGKPTIKVASEILEDIKKIKQKSDKFKKSLEVEYKDKESWKPMLGLNLSQSAKKYLKLEWWVGKRWWTKFLSAFDSLDITLPKSIKTAEDAENLMKLVKTIKDSTIEKVFKNWMIESHNKTLISDMDDSFVELDIKTPKTDSKFAMDDVYRDYVFGSKKMEQSNMFIKYGENDIVQMKQILENSWLGNAKLYLLWGSITKMYDTKWFFLVEAGGRSVIFPVQKVWVNAEVDSFLRKKIEFLRWDGDMIKWAIDTSDENLSNVLSESDILYENADIAVKAATEEKWNQFVVDNFWDYHDFRWANNQAYKYLTYFVTTQEKIKHMLPVLNDWLQEYLIRAKENFESIFKWVFNEWNRAKYLSSDELITFKDDIHTNRNYYNLFFTLQKMFPEKMKQLEWLWWFRNFYETVLKWKSQPEMLDSVRKFLTDKWMSINSSTELLNKYDMVRRQIDRALNWEIVEWLVTMKALYSIAIDDWASVKWRWIFEDIINKTTDMIVKTYDKWFAVSWDAVKKEIEKIVRNYFVEWPNKFNLAHWLSESFESFKLLDDVQTWLKQNFFKDKLWFKVFQDLLTETFWNDWKRIYRELFKDETQKLPTKILKWIRQARYLLATSYTGSWAYIAMQNVLSWVVEWTSRWKLSKNSYNDFVWFLDNLKKVADGDSDTVLKQLLEEIWYGEFSHDVLTNWIQKTMEVERTWLAHWLPNKIADAIYYVATKMDKDISPLRRQKIQSIVSWWFIPMADKVVEWAVLSKSIYNLVLSEKNISIRQLNEFLNLYKKAGTPSAKQAIATKIADILSSAKREANYRYSQFYTSWVNKAMVRNNRSRHIWINMFTAWSSKKIWQYFYNWILKPALDTYHIYKKYDLSHKEAMAMLSRSFLNDHLASQFIAMVWLWKYGSKLMLDDDVDSESLGTIARWASPLWQAINANFITHSLRNFTSWYSEARKQDKDMAFSMINWAKNASYTVLWQFAKDVKLFSNAANAYFWAKTQWLTEAQAGRIMMNQVMKRAMNNVLYNVYDIYQWIEYEKSNLSKASWLLDVIIWEPITAWERWQRDWIDRVYWEKGIKEDDTVWTLVSQMRSNTKDSLLFWSLNVRNQNAMILLDNVKNKLAKDWTYMKLVNNDVSWLSDELKLIIFNNMSKGKYRNNFRRIEWDERNMDKMWNNAALILNDMAGEWIDVNKFVKLLTSDVLSDKMEAGLILRAVNNTESESAVVLSYYMNTLYEALKKEYKDTTWAKKIDDDVLDNIKVRIATLFWPLMLQLDKSQKNDLMVEYIKEAYPTEDKALWDGETTSAKRALTLQLMAADLDSWEAEWDKSRFNNIWALMLKDIPDNLAPKTIWEYFDWIGTQGDISDETKSVMMAGILYWNRSRLMKLFADEEFRKKAEPWLKKLAELIWDTDERLQTSDDIQNLWARRWWVSKVKVWNFLDAMKWVAEWVTKMRDTVSSVAPWIADRVVSQRLNKSETPNVKFNPLPTLDEQKEIEYKAKLRELTTKPILTEWVWAKKSKPVSRRVAYKVKKLVKKPWA